MEVKHTQAKSMQKILQWLVNTAPFQYRITTHQNGELHIKMEVPEIVNRYENNQDDFLDLQKKIAESNKGDKNE